MVWGAFGFGGLFGGLIGFVLGDTPALIALILSPLAYLSCRAMRVAVLTDVHGVTVRGMLRTVRVPWTRVDSFSYLPRVWARPPNAKRGTTVHCLVIEDVDGEVRDFAEISSYAREDSPDTSVVSQMVTELNALLEYWAPRTAQPASPIGDAEA